MNELPRRRAFQVNAFTKQLSGGNPAGVVLGADGLSDDEMRRIADGLKAADTAFVFEPTSGDHDVLVRFLTPRREALFIGHATLAAQYVLARTGSAKRKLRQRCGIGIVDIEILQDADQDTNNSAGNSEESADYRVAVTQGAPALGPMFPQQHRAAVLDALGLSSMDLHPDYPLQLVAEKAPRLFIGLRSPQLLGALRPDFAELKRLSPRVGAEGYFVFALDSRAPAPTTHSRLFCPIMGIPEDPVSGNTHAMLGVYLVRHGLLEPKDGRAIFRGHQGDHMGRPGIIDVEIACEDRGVRSVRVMGDAVIASETPL